MTQNQEAFHHAVSRQFSALNCDAGVSVASVYITQVTSDEAENGKADGNTSNDIVSAPIAIQCNFGQSVTAL